MLLMDADVDFCDFDEGIDAKKNTEVFLKLFFANSEQQTAMFRNK